MRHFIFTILLVVPLLLTAQSKKEQIATLNLKVDSLFEVLVNNAQKLSDQRGEIFQLSQEKSDLEKSIVQISQEKLSLETEMSLKNSSLDTMQVQLQLAQDEIAKLLTDLSTALKPGSNHNYMIGMFDGLEMTMGCHKNLIFRICDDCLQVYLNEQELEIIKNNKDWEDFNNWVSTVEMSSQFSFDQHFNDESGEWEECCVYMGDGCCPVGDETALEFLNLNKGDICRIDYNYDGVIIGVDHSYTSFDAETGMPYGCELTKIKKLSDNEINLFFIVEGEEENYDDW
jgi:hypothetical protein